MTVLKDSSGFKFAVGPSESDFLRIFLCARFPTEIPIAVSLTVENAQTNNKTKLFRSKFFAKNRAFAEPFKKEKRARTACFPVMQKSSYFLTI